MWTPHRIFATGANYSSMSALGDQSPKNYPLLRWSFSSLRAMIVDL